MIDLSQLVESGKMPLSDRIDPNIFVFSCPDQGKDAQ